MFGGTDAMERARQQSYRDLGSTEPFVNFVQLAGRHVQFSVALAPVTEPRPATLSNRAGGAMWGSRA